MRKNLAECRKIRESCRDILLIVTPYKDALLVDNKIHDIIESVIALEAA